MGVALILVIAAMLAYPCTNGNNRKLCSISAALDVVLAEDEY